MIVNELKMKNNNTKRFIIMLKNNMNQRWKKCNHSSFNNIDIIFISIISYIILSIFLIRLLN